MADDRRRIEGYLTRLYGYAFSLVRDHAEAEDLVQNCAMKALGARNVPADERAYRSWLFRILRNQFIDGLRRERRKNFIFAEPPSEDDEKMEYWRGDERLIDVVNVRLAFGKLDVRQREILALIDIAGLSYREAAGVLGVAEGTVMSRISRARGICWRSSKNRTCGRWRPNRGRHPRTPRGRSDGAGKAKGRRNRE